MGDVPRIGIVAVQGDVREHAAMLRRLGAEVVEVRKPEQLEGLGGLVIPGGESTTMGRLVRLYGLEDGIRRFEGAVFGTCAGMILLAGDALDGVPGQPLLGLVDVVVRRNGYGRQVASFEADLELAGDERPLRGVFIRAPRVEHVGPEVDVLAELDGEPVLLRQGRVLVAAFHPELTDDARVHELFLELTRAGASRLPGTSVAKEASERRAGQYSDVRPSAASAASCRQRRQAAAEAGSAGREPSPAREARSVGA